MAIKEFTAPAPTAKRPAVKDTAVLSTSTSSTNTASTLQGDTEHMNGDSNANGNGNNIDGEDMELDLNNQDNDESSEEEINDKVIVHVEVCQKISSPIMKYTIISCVQSYIYESIGPFVYYGRKVENWDDVDFMRSNIQSIKFEDDVYGRSSIRLEEAEFTIHVYKETDEQVDEFSAALDEEDESESSVSAASITSLPSADFSNLWENLIFSNDVKFRLLDYVYTSMFFADADVNYDIVAWNRLVLLHGPPGTGKTSLCRALAQKIAIRLSDQYSSGKLVEINSHSLFSKWFSESGKLVHKLFQNVTNLVNDPSCFVVVMIDEVESLTMSREKGVSKEEPSDYMRSVNAVLTQIDKLRMRKNVLVMTTSNIITAIDKAFLSRADYVEYISLPPPEAIYGIVSGILRELMERDIVKQYDIPSWDEIPAVKPGQTQDRPVRVGRALRELAVKCHANEVSGRTLRRLPLLAHTKYLKSPRNHLQAQSGERKAIKIEKWIEAMSKAVPEPVHDDDRVI